MSNLRILAAATAAGVSLFAAPAALAKTSSVGHSSGTPTTNICVASFNCTYINYKHGNPTDVVNHSGSVADWSVNAGSVGGQVQLRVLRPVGHGKFEFVRSSKRQTVASPGKNTFAAHLKVNAGDVLALTNDTSGIYMSSAPAGTSVRYFDSSVHDGSSGKPNRETPKLHLLLSADVQH
jgi:hypothetical protein